MASMIRISSTRIHCVKLLKLTILLFSCGIFLLTHHYANRHYHQQYQLSSFAQQQANYELALNLTLDQLSLIDDGDGQVDDDKNEDNNVIIQDDSQILDSINIPSPSLNVANKTVSSPSLSLTRMNQLESILKYLHSNNLTQNIVRTSKFDPFANIEDNHLYLHWRQLHHLDRILTLNYSGTPQQQPKNPLAQPTNPLAQNPIDKKIDQRRSEGKLTNLKLSDFEGITRVRHGALPCDAELGARTTVAVFVITKPNDFLIRSIIRKTWGERFAAPDSTARLYFAFGRYPVSTDDHESSSTEESFHTVTMPTTTTPLSPDMIKQLIQLEQQQFRDVIQWDFDDGYYRLTIKSLAILRWTSLYCPRVKAVFKIDADCMLNYDNLVRFVRSVVAKLPAMNESRSSLSSPTTSAIPTNVNTTEPEYYIFGNIWRSAAVIRSSQSKFFTSFYDYPHTHYPDYVGGPWLLIGHQLPRHILRQAILRSMPALLWEDLYVTGIVAQKLIDDVGLRVQRHRLPGFSYMLPVYKINACTYAQSIIITQTINQTNLEMIWQRITSENDDNEQQQQQKWPKKKQKIFNKIVNDKCTLTW